MLSSNISSSTKEQPKSPRQGKSPEAGRWNFWYCLFLPNIAANYRTMHKLQNSFLL